MMLTTLLSAHLLGLVPNERDAIMRVPYTPLSKIPFTANDFFKKQKKIKIKGTGHYITTNPLKAGDFIGYRMPMSLHFGNAVTG